jgi:hypothetical protein
LVSCDSAHISSAKKPSAIVRDGPPDRDCAAMSGTYPRLVAAASTRRRVSSLTLALPDSVRDTVARETPARRATSSLVATIRPFVRKGCRAWTALTR